MGPLRVVSEGRSAGAGAVSAAAEASRPRWVLYLILWLAGIQLRETILAVPPVLPSIHADLGLSATQIGILASLPIAAFALAALPGALMIARLGAKAALLGGLAVTAIGSALRGLAVDAPTLYAATLAMGAGMAVMQPTMSVLVRDWLPSRVGFATALYSNGLMFGEFFPVWVTIPVVLPLVGGNWRSSLAAWSLPVVATALVAWALAPGARPGMSAAAGAQQRWWPNWRQSLIWVLGLLFGSINGLYFATNFFLPDFLGSFGRNDLIAPALTALNFAQIPASLLMLAMAHRFERRAWPYVVLAAIDAAGVLGLALAVGPWTWLFAAMVGFATSAGMILGLTLPVLLSAPSDVGRNSAGMFTVSYSTGVLTAIASGACWDLSGVPALVFLPIGLCTLSLGGTALVLRRQGRLR